METCEQDRTEAVDQVPRRPIKVGDLIHSVFDGRLPESYSVEVRGDFGQAGLHRVNDDDDERASIEPYGDWSAPLGPGAVIVTVRDEDESEPEAGPYAMALLTQAMLACGRKVRHRDDAGSQRMAAFSPARYAATTEALRLEYWCSRTSIPVPVVVRA